MSISPNTEYHSPVISSSLGANPSAAEVPPNKSVFSSIRQYFPTSLRLYGQKSSFSVAPRPLPLMDRKIRKLEAEGRPYLLKTLLPASASSSTEKRAACSSEFQPGTAQWTNNGEPQRQIKDGVEAIFDNATLSTPLQRHFLGASQDAILSYYSKGEHAALNCLGTNEQNSNLGPNNGKIVCRHLAYAFADNQFGPNHPNKFADIDQAEKISHHPGILSDVQLKHVFANRIASEAYYFNLEIPFGHIVKAAVNYQIARNHQERNYLLSSVIHDMALTIALSEDGQTIRLTFYDPNDTLRVHRIILSSPEALESLCLHDVIRANSLPVYFPETPSAGCLLSFDTKEQQAGNHAQLFGELNSTNAYLMMKYGHFGHFLREKLKDKNIHSLCLNVDGYPPLFSAMQRNHSEAIKFYIETVLDQVKDDVKVAEILAAKETAEGYSFPALFIALQKNSAEAVAIYMELILNSELDNQTKKELLAAKNDWEYPALGVAFKFHAEQAIQNYTEAILTSQLDNKSKRELLMARCLEGDCVPFHYALISSYQPELLTNFFNTILKSDLDNQSKKELLAMKMPDSNLTCLAFAVFHGKIEFVEHHIHQILTSSLDDQSKIELLYAKDSKGISAMQYAIGAGYENVILSYSQAIRNADNLTDETKQMLLNPFITIVHPASK